MRHADYVRNFEWLLRLLAERGHSVHLAFERGGRNADLAERLVATSNGSISFGFAPVRWDIWQPLSETLGRSIDYLRYRSPVYREATYLRERATRDVPPIVVRLSHWRLGVRVLDRLLRAWERAIPPLPELSCFMESQACDLLMVTPLVSEQSQHSFARSARAAGRPVVLAVHSWDNLTNKGLIRETPDQTYVWNDIQRREAVELHGLPPESVIAVGAHSFDHWFAWTPSRDRVTFCAEMGLDPAQPFLLYVGSSLQIAPDERPFILRWLEAVRSDPVVARDLGILIRPHPYAGRTWRTNPFEGLTNVTIFPRHGAEPRSESRRADYYDSIYHAAAVVGLNTSALVEAAIVGRRTYTVVLHDLGNTQAGTLHFHYLLADNGGPLVPARSLEEHVEHLREALDAPPQDDEWRRSFLTSFVRPRGLDRAAAPLFAEDLERFHAAFAASPAPTRTSLLTALLRPLAWLLYVRAYGLPSAERIRLGNERPRRKSLRRRGRARLRRFTRRPGKRFRRAARNVSPRRLQRRVRKRLKAFARG
jgi:hypothetical protein